MAYTRPAVTVIQQFQNLAPALASFTLPSVAIGPAYQLVTNDVLGVYDGSAETLAYVSKLAGATVDTSTVISASDPYPATELPVTVSLQNALVQMVAPATTGAVNGINFTDASSDQFADVLAGDLVVITDRVAVTIVSAQTNGSSTTANPNQLVGTGSQFTNVKVGDSVVVTAGTNATPGTYTVTALLPSDTLLLDGNVNDGGGASSDTAYSITGDRGDVNQGTYTVQAVASANALTLTSPAPQVESLLGYSIVRPFATLALTPGANGFTPTTAGLELVMGITYTINAVPYPVVGGTVLASYRALRNDLAGTVEEYSQLSDVQATFGATQITPANPLAFALSLMLQNTTTPINGLGLDSNAVVNETLSYTNALTPLTNSTMYALVPLTQNPAIHGIMQSHVDGLSLAGKERVAILNRQLVTQSTLQDEATTVLTQNDSRIILNTKVTGHVLFASPHNFNDATLGQFVNVQEGDTLVIVGGTNANPGSYTITTVTDNNNLVCSGSNLASADATGVQYYIIRLDGLGADGSTFYDRNAAFISNGVTPGDLISIMSGTYLGQYVISSVVSNNEVLISQIPGVVSLVTAVDYEVVANLSRDQQAAFLAGYSASFADRRVVMVWPDTVQAPVGQTLQYLPGFYAGCAIGAITTGMPPQQGFTNLSVSGFLGLLHSNGYFTDAQLDTIAGGGTFIFVQEVAEAPLSIRHQLTTNTSAIQFQEYSVTKNVDYISMYIRQEYKSFIGPYNIVGTTFDELRNTAKAIITFLKEETLLPRIGGVITSGILSSLAQDPVNIDAVDITFTMDIPIPLNNLDITVIV